MICLVILASYCITMSVTNLLMIKVRLTFYEYIIPSIKVHDDSHDECYYYYIYYHYFCCCYIY